MELRKQSLPRSILIGAVVGLVCALILSLVIATLIHRGTLPMQAASSIGAAMLIVSVFAGCAIASRLQGSKLLITSFATAAVILGLALLCKAAFFAGWSERTAVGLCGAGGAALLAAFLPQRKGRRHKR